MEYSNAQFYSAFNEISEIICDDKCWEPILDELLINACDLSEIAVRHSYAIMDLFKTCDFANTGLLTIQGELSDAKIFKSFDKKNDIEYLVSIWVDGFITHLKIKEHLGLTWDEINKTTFENSENLRRRTGENKARTELDIFVKNSKQIITHRAIHFLHILRMQRPPTVKMPVPTKDRAIVLLGEIMFSDGFYTASTVETRTVETRPESIPAL